MLKSSRTKLLSDEGDRNASDTGGTNYIICENPSNEGKPNFDRTIICGGILIQATSSGHQLSQWPSTG